MSWLTKKMNAAASSVSGVLDKAGKRYDAAGKTFIDQECINGTDCKGFPNVNCVEREEGIKKCTNSSLVEVAKIQADKTRKKASEIQEKIKIAGKDAVTTATKGSHSSNEVVASTSNCNCVSRLNTIILQLQRVQQDCKTCQCCNPDGITINGGNKKSVKNTKRKGKFKSVKKRSSQSGGKVHPWREHIKKTRLSHPGVKDFGQIIQMAKQTYKK